MRNPFVFSYGGLLLDDDVPKLVYPFRYFAGIKVFISKTIEYVQIISIYKARLCVCHP